MGAKRTADAGRKRNDSFRAGTVESYRSLGIVPADLFRPLRLVELRPACAHFGSGRLHSITPSARPSSVGGTVRPRAFALLRLITSSNFSGASTGSSLGFAPLKMRSA